MLECHHKTLSLRKLEERAVYQRILDPTAHRTLGSQPLTIPGTSALPEKRTGQVPAVVSASHDTGVSTVVVHTTRPLDVDILTPDFLSTSLLPMALKSAESA